MVQREDCGCNPTSTLSTTWEEGAPIVTYIVGSYYKEESDQDETDREEFEWKEKENRYAAINYKSKIIPRVIVQPARIKVKRFKQKIR